MKSSMIEIISVAGVIGLAVIGVALFMSATGRDLPEWLVGSAGLIIGYFYRGNRNGKNGDSDASQHPKDE